MQVQTRVGQIKIIIVMGSFRKPHPKKHSLHDLQEIASVLAESMLREREKWLAACIQLMNSLDFGQEKITNKDSHGTSDQIIKSFQIVHALSFANMQNYTKSNIREFTRLLCALVCSEDWDKCEPFVQRYTELKQEYRDDKLHEHFLKFSEDLSLATAGSSIGILLAPAVDATVVDFYYRTIFLVAVAFDDKEMCTKLRKSIEKLCNEDQQTLPEASINEKTIKSIEEKAAELPDTCRVLIGIVEPSLRRDHSDFFAIPNAMYFTLYATIACVWTACVRLHFDVSKQRRTPIEKKVQENLAKLHPEAIREYENIHRFVSERLLLERDRKKRGSLMFKLASSWVVYRMLGCEPSGKYAKLVECLESVFMNDTSGYWK